MTLPDLATRGEGPGLGWAHVSFGLPTRHDVDRLVSRMEQAGVPLVDGPREIGGGYYEAVLLDPEGNRVEIVDSDYSDKVADRPTS